ncbi:MAG: hypothetical protein WAN43_00005, partial [Rhodomicrobium sp.]
HRSLSAIRPDYKAGHAISLLLEEKILRQNQFSEKLDFSHSLGLKHHTGMTIACGLGPIVMKHNAVTPAGTPRKRRRKSKHRPSDPSPLSRCGIVGDRRVVLAVGRR